MGLLESLGQKSSGPSISSDGASILSSGAHLLSNATSELGQNFRLDKTILGELKQQDLINKKDMINNAIDQFSQTKRAESKYAKDISVSKDHLAEKINENEKTIKINDSNNQTKKDMNMQSMLKQEHINDQNNKRMIKINADNNAKELKRQANDFAQETKVNEQKHNYKVSDMYEKAKVDDSVKMSHTIDKFEVNMNDIENDSNFKTNALNKALVYIAKSKGKDIKPEQISKVGSLLNTLGSGGNLDNPEEILTGTFPAFNEAITDENSIYYKNIVVKMNSGASFENALSSAYASFINNNYEVDMQSRWIGTGPVGFRLKRKGEDALRKKAKDDSKKQNDTTKFGTFEKEISNSSATRG